MDTIIRLYSNKNGEILRFLNHFYKNDNLKLEDGLFLEKQYFKLQDDLLWEKQYENPLEMADMIAALIENQEDYKITMWICLDKDLFINITNNNYDDVIRYLYERYPY